MKLMILCPEGSRHMADFVEKLTRFPETESLMMHNWPYMKIDSKMCDVMKIFMTTSCKTHDTVDSYALHLVSLMFENTANWKIMNPMLDENPHVHYRDHDGVHWASLRLVSVVSEKKVKFKNWLHDCIFALMVAPHFPKAQNVNKKTIQQTQKWIEIEKST